MNRFQKMIMRAARVDPQVLDCEYWGPTLVGEECGCDRCDRERDLMNRAHKERDDARRELNELRRLLRSGGAPWPPPTFGVDFGSGRDRSVVHQVNGTKVQPPAPLLVTGRNFRTPDEGPPIVDGVILDENDQPLDLRIRPVRGPGVLPSDAPCVLDIPDAPAAPQASAVPHPADGPPDAPIATEPGSGPPEAARSTFIPPLDSVVAAMVGETPWGEKVYGLDRPGLPEFPPNFLRMIDEADARRHADREAERAAVRLPDEGPPVIAGVILDDPMPPRSCRPSADQAETQKAALANVATALKAAAADPDSATLSATLAGMRAAEDAVFEALNGFESKFRGCVVRDIRIERCAQLGGSSRIAGVLIDLKLQNAQL